MGAGIDWERFAERIPAGTTIIEPNPYVDFVLDGILLENKPYSDWEYPSGDLTDPDHAINPARLRVQIFMFGRMSHYHPVKDLIYLINGQWLTFSEVMADEK